MTAVESMKREIRIIQRQQSECMSEDGVILNHRKYEYQTLCQEAKKYKDSVDWMERTFAKKYISQENIRIIEGK